MTTPHIHAAMCAGGKFRVVQQIPNKLILKAHISFPDGKVVAGNISLTLLGAIENLETELVLKEVQS